jgi:hypothetical protein
MTSCQLCTFENDKSSIVCEICEAPLRRPGLPVDGPYGSLASHCARCGDCAECQLLANEEKLIEMLVREMAEKEAEYVLPNDMCHRCPYCRIPIEVVAVNCGIFICGCDVQGQVNPHDENGALRARLVSGCGGQSKLQDGRLVPCTGL